MGYDYAADCVWKPLIVLRNSRNTICDRQIFAKNGNGEKERWEAQKIGPVASIVLKARAFQEKPVFVIDKGFDIEPI